MSTEDTVTEKAERFKKLAPQRVTNAIKAIRIAARCADPNVYHYSDAEAKAICKTLRSQVERACEAFELRHNPEFYVFHLPEPPGIDAETIGANDNADPMPLDDDPGDSDLIGDDDQPG